MRTLKSICFLLFLSGVSSFAVASPYKVNAIQESELKENQDAITSAIGKTTLENIEIFRGQSFQVSSAGKAGIFLFNGKGKAVNADGVSVDMCFAVIVPKDKHEGSHFVPTIGTWNWEALSCGDVLGVGFIPDKSADLPKAVLLYSASSPNEESKPSVILAWNNKRMVYEIDESLSKRSESSTERTIKAITVVVAKNK